MSRYLPQFLLLLGLAALPATGQSPTRISADAPIINFRLPTYTVPDGYRAWLIRGSEARVGGPNEITIKELTMTIFSGDAKEHIETMILSPTAKVAPQDQIATGEDTIRVINDGFEATGTGWRYQYKDKTVSIAHHVRVVLHGELKGLLK